MDTTHEVWLRNFEQVADAIPRSWLITAEDGSEWIAVERASDRLVKLHRELCLVGYAKGWL